MFLWGWLNKQQVDLKKHSGKSLQLTHWEIKGECIRFGSLVWVACELLMIWEGEDGDTGKREEGEPGDAEQVLNI